ncbi:hypothetical protein WJX72_007970 [[Myrmecia] bisecta]|uniref:Uncharacterized protein n=1 Tax=[Myrmecia] bisecta TaxID=41462 RepID=A0AAW1PWP4_9CHLO
MLAHRVFDQQDGGCLNVREANAVLAKISPATGASGAGLQAVLANSVKEGLPCCLIVADFDGEVAAYRWKKGEADATEPPQQPSEAHLLEVLRHILAVYEAKTSKHVEAKGVVLLLQMNK